MCRENPRVKAAVYVSDYSEVPGVWHAADLFESEMTEIPMFLYLSETLRKQRSALERTLRKNVGGFSRMIWFSAAGSDGKPSPFLYFGAPDRRAGVCAENGGGTYAVGRAAAGKSGHEVSRALTSNAFSAVT